MVKSKGVEIVKEIKLRKERRQEWKNSRHEFETREEWYKSWGNYKIK